MKKVITLLLALIMGLTLTGCKKAANDGLVDGKIVRGVLEMNEAEKAFYREWAKTDPDSAGIGSIPDNLEQKELSSITQMLLELDAGKLSFLSALPLCTAQYICATNSKYSYASTNAQYYFKMATVDNNKAMCDNLNAAIATVKSDGTLDALMEKYVNDVSAQPDVNALTKIDGAQTIKVGVTGDFPPFDYIATDGTPTGFNVALLEALSKQMNVNFELVLIDANARSTALSTGTIDIAFWMLVTADSSAASYPESKLIFTDAFYSSANAVVTKDYPIDSIKEIYGMK